MSVGSGLAGSFGMATESTYGTYVAPTRFLEVNKTSLKKVKNTVQGGGLAAGRLVDPSVRRVVTTTAGSGSIDTEVTNKAFGLLLAHIFGGVVTPTQQAATTAYLQTHPLADNVGRYLTTQVGVPDLAGTVRPYTFLGSKVTAAEFSCGVDTLLTASVDLDVRAVSEASSLAAPSYSATATPFHFGLMAVKIGTYNSEASVSGVRKVSVKIDRGQNTDRFYGGAAGLKAEPIMNDVVKVTGTIDTDYVDKTMFADRHAADTGFSLVWEFVGPLIASTYYETFRLTLPACYLDTDTPTLDGPDVVSPSFGFSALYDGTNAAVTATYMSTDTAL